MSEDVKNLKSEVNDLRKSEHVKSLESEVNDR